MAQIGYNMMKDYGKYFKEFIRKTDIKQRQLPILYDTSHFHGLCTVRSGNKCRGSKGSGCEKMLENQKMMQKLDPFLG